MAEWYSREGSHERLRGVCARTLETRVNETKVLKHFLQTLNSRNPFLPASNLAIEPLSALVPLVTGPEKTTGHSPLQMPSGLIKLRSDNVLASAARAGENPQKATARYHVSLPPQTPASTQTLTQKGGGKGGGNVGAAVVHILVNASFP